MADQTVTGMRTFSPHRSVYPAVAFVVTLALYVRTLCPTVYVGDSGEFITNAVTLGINHPTGYPLFTLLGRLIVLISPWWNAAQSVNFLSALCSAAAVVCVYFASLQLVERPAVALAAAMLYGFSSTLWGHATTAEVYALNALFVGLSTLLVLRWNRNQRVLDLLLLSYLVGLGMSQHITGALVTVSMIVLILLKKPKIVLDVRLLAALFLVGLIGFSSYLYLPFRSVADPPIDWGNPETPRLMYEHLFPRTGKTLFRELGSDYQDRILWIITQAFSREFWYYGAVSILGLLVLATEWRLVAFFLSAIGLNVFFTVLRRLPLHADFDAYFMPSYLLMALLMGVAIDAAWTRVERYRSEASRRVVVIAGIVALVLAPASLILVNYHENDRSTNWFGYDFGMNMLARVPENAVLFTVGDEQTFLGWYFKYVEKKRPDITVIDQKILGASWGASHMYNRDLNLRLRESDTADDLARAITEQFMGKRPIVATPRIPWEFMGQEYELWNTGMVVELFPKGSALPPYEPTEYSFHPGWTEQYFDERSKLMVKFYYKEFIINGSFWYLRGQLDPALHEVNSFLQFPGPKDSEDMATAYLLRAQVSMDRKLLAEAQTAVDSAAVYGPADWRVFEIKGNISFQRKDVAAAMEQWNRSLLYNPNNPTIRQNIDILTRQTPARH